jgi:hypothetical protein
MPYVYPEVGSLDGRPAVGTQQCVALVEFYAQTPAPAAVHWRQGGPVKDNDLIAKGTAIATFVNGVYPSAASGNHAALYVSQDQHGLWVVDQYVGSNGIHKRLLRFKGKDGNGDFVDPVNNGDAFSIIE